MGESFFIRLFLCVVYFDILTQTFMPHHSPSSFSIAVIGAGNVGATTAFVLSLKHVASEILLIDVDEKKEAGEVLDIADGLSLMETGAVRGANFRDAATADIIIVTAGARQKTGETRLDLIRTNTNILQTIFASIGVLKKHAIVIMVTNPVDAMTQLALRITKLPAGQVFGTGTTLDTARLKTAIGQKLGVSPQSVHGYVLGEHGDSGFVAWSTVTVGGIPAAKLLNAADRRRIETDVRNAAYAIIDQKGATFYGIATVVSDIVEAVVYDQKKILPVTTPLIRGNGISDVCLGTPAVIGACGVERQWKAALSPEEKKKLSACGRMVRGLAQ